MPDGETDAVTAFQCANSDLRLSPRFHPLFLDRIYAPDRDGKGLMFHPAPAPGQEYVEQVALQVSKRILRFSSAAGSSYIPWAELLHRTFGVEIVCQNCPRIPLAAPAVAAPAGASVVGEGFFDAEIPPSFRLDARVASMGRLVASDDWFRLDILGILFG